MESHESREIPLCHAAEVFRRVIFTKKQLLYKTNYEFCFSFLRWSLIGSLTMWCIRSYYQLKTSSGNLQLCVSQIAGTSINGLVFGSSYHTFASKSSQVVTSIQLLFSDGIKNLADGRTSTRHFPRTILYIKFPHMKNKSEVNNLTPLMGPARTGRRAIQMYFTFHRTKKRAPYTSRITMRIKELI